MLILQLDPLFPQCWILKAWNKIPLGCGHRIPVFQYFNRPWIIPIAQGIRH